MQTKVSRICTSVVNRFCTNALKDVKGNNNKSGMVQAILAEQTIKQICKGENVEQQKILSDRIRSIQLSDASKQVLKNQFSCTEEQICKSQNLFFNAFKVNQGVKLPKLLITSQQRFSNAKNQNGKITFYPSSLVTSQIFSALKQKFPFYSKQSNSIVYGKPGIAKSFSFILYWYLSHLSADYRYKFQDDAKTLIANKLLQAECYKLLYVNFNAEIIGTIEFMNDVLAQCVQLSEQEVKKLKNSMQTNEQMYKFLQQIKYTYAKKNILCYMIVDQINVLAQTFQKFNEMQRKVNQNKQNSYLTRDSPSYKELLSRVQLLNYIHRSIRNSIPRIYNSSSNIERELLGNNDETSHRYYTLGLPFHTQPAIINIAYNNIKNEAEIKQLYRNIWYEAAKLLTEQQLTNEVQTKFINSCDELAKQKGFSTFLTPLAIANTIKANSTLKANPTLKANSTLKAISTLKDVIKKNEKSVYYQFISSLYNEICPEGMRKLQLKSVNFLKDPINEKKIIKSEIALACLSYFNENKDDLEVKWSDITKYHNYSNLTDSQLKNYIDKNVFSFQGNKIRLIVSREEFQLISNQWLLTILMDPVLSPVFKRYVKNSKSQYFQFAVDILLLNNSQSSIQFGNEFYDYEKMKHFPNLLGSNSNIYNNIEKLYQQANKLSIRPNCIFGRPSRTNKSSATAQSSKNNPSFDFLVIRKTKNNQFQVTSMDVTSSRDKSYIDGKFIKAQKFLKTKLNDDSSDNFEFIQKGYKKEFASQLLQFLDQQIYQMDFAESFNSQRQQIFQKIKLKNKKNKNNVQEIIKLNEEIQKSVEGEQQAQEIKRKLITCLVKQKIIQLKLKNLIKWRHVVIFPKSEQNPNIKLPQSWVTIYGTKVQFAVNPISVIDLNSLNSRLLSLQTLEVLKLLKVVFDVDNSQ